MVLILNGASLVHCNPVPPGFLNKTYQYQHVLHLPQFSEESKYVLMNAFDNVVILVVPLKIITSFAAISVSTPIVLELWY